MIYAYAISEAHAAHSPPSGRGLGGATLRTLRYDGLGAVYSRHRSLRARPATAHVVTHERVVEALMAHGAVLPLRFGTQLGTEEDLETALADRREELLRSLERVRGHVELGLRVLPRGAPEREQGSRPPARECSDQVAAPSGRDYLLGRVADHRRAERIARRLHSPLSALASASVVREQPPAPAILAAAYLVDSNREGEFRVTAQELAAPLEEAQAVVTGPWPPYSFVAGEHR